jgi:hypothetical protein
VAQLVGAESEAINIRDVMRESQHRHAVLAWQRDYFARSAQLDLAKLSGGALLDRLESMLKPADGTGGDPDDSVREARASVVADLSFYRGRYADGYTLLRLPAERLPRTGPTLAMTVVGAVLASLLLATLLTLAFRWRSLLD